MIHRTLLAIATIVATAAPGASFAADLENGNKLARQCSACHGRQGISRDPEVPIIAGQHAFYLEKALKDYRDGGREDRRMTLIVQRLSDTDIKDLAAHFAAFEIGIKELD
ncbi:cytochrome c [Jannaschia sp. M317]|uniref:c-type cytochrome n=1 Tax=Jannaschia sp. M317 TaxID=2867011 RepID=UPI0021A2E2FD|nr:cytochrome c [Jannaschia sp. M317]UWQ17058.1 cytochrome c [Jannaschia sp. M317]